MDQPDPMQYQKGSLYHILGRVDEQLFALAGRASQLLDWERDHQYCGRCGNPMRVDIQERAMRCDPCRAINYPAYRALRHRAGYPGRGVVAGAQCQFSPADVQHAGRLYRSG